MACRVTANDQGPGAAERFSMYLGIPCRLVCQADDAVRPIDAEFAKPPTNEVSFADGYPLMLILEDSLSDLNARQSVALPMNRFRPTSLWAAGVRRMRKTTGVTSRLAESLSAWSERVRAAQSRCCVWAAVKTHQTERHQIGRALPAERVARQPRPGDRAELESMSTEPTGNDQSRIAIPLVQDEVPVRGAVVEADPLL